MTYAEATGDLFEMDFDAYGHGVNCVGVMGSGIAPFFRDLDKNMYQTYQYLCAGGGLIPGTVMPWRLNNDRYVYNLATQFRLGNDARLDAVERSVQQMFYHAEQMGVETIGIPRIGCGIGGLDWKDVRMVLLDVAESTSKVTLTAVTLPGRK